MKVSVAQSCLTLCEPMESVYLVIYHLPIYVPICHLYLCGTVCVCVCVCNWVMVRSIRTAVYLEDQRANPQHSIRSGIFPEGWIIHSGSCPEKGVVLRQKVGIIWVNCRGREGVLTFPVCLGIQGPSKIPCWWGWFSLGVIVL